MCPFICGSLCGAASGWIWCTWCLIKFLIVLNYLGIFSKNCHGRIRRHDTDTSWYYWNRQAIWWYQRFKFHSDFCWNIRSNVIGPEWFKWKFVPGYSTLLRYSLNIDLTSPYVLDNDHAVPPWLEVFFHLRWFCPLRGFMFVEYSSCEFLCCQTNSHVQTNGI